MCASASTGQGVDHSPEEGGPAGRPSSLTSEPRLGYGVQFPHLQTATTMAHRKGGKRSRKTHGAGLGPQPPVLLEWGPEGKARLQQREMGQWTFLGEGKEGARRTFSGKHEKHGSFSSIEMQAAVWE